MLAILDPQSQRSKFMKALAGCSRYSDVHEQPVRRWIDC